MNRKLYTALFLVFIPALLAGCGGMTQSGSSSGGGDLNFRVAQLEQRVNNIDTSGAASSWSDQEAMRNDLNVLRNQMTDLNNRLDGSGRGGDLSAEVAVLKQRVDRLEAAMAQLQSQLGLDLEAMKTPIAPPAALGPGGAGLTTPQPPVATPQPPLDGVSMQQPLPGATPQPQLNGAPPQAQTGAYGTVPPAATTTAPGTETVIINGVPQQLAVNPNAGATPPVDSNAAATAAAGAPVQYGAPEATAADPATALYNSGTAAFNNRQYNDALKIFTDFTKNYPKHNLTSNAWFWQGETNYQLQNYGNAALAYQEVITKFSKSNKLPAAMLKQGMSFEKLGKREAANARYKELIKTHPNSPEAKRAKTLIR